MNMQNTDARIRIEGLHNEHVFVFTYIFSPHYSLQSSSIRLNGELLLVYKKGYIPRLKPVLLTAKPYLVIPSFSTVFWVIQTNKVKACNGKQ